MLRSVQMLKSTFFLLRFIYFVLSVWVFCSYVLLCTMHAWCLWRSEEGASSLELKLWKVVSHHVEARNQTKVLCMNNVLNHSDIVPGLNNIFVKAIVIY